MDGSTLYGESRVINNGTITRSNGLVSSIAIALGRTKTYSRNAQGFVTGATDGEFTWVYNRDANNNLTSWSVS